jgi:hypothetical protein
MISEIANRHESLPGVRRVALWTGLIGGGLAWTLHLVSVYAIGEFGCVAGLGERHYAGISLVAWMVIAATAATAGLGILATFVAYRSARRSPDRAFREMPSDGEQATARAGVLASGFFTFVILFEAIPVLFYLRDC